MALCVKSSKEVQQCEHGSLVSMAIMSFSANGAVSVLSSDCVASRMLADVMWCGWSLVVTASSVILP